MKNSEKATINDTDLYIPKDYLSSLKALILRICAIGGIRVTFKFNSILKPNFWQKMGNNLVVIEMEGKYHLGVLVGDLSTSLLICENENELSIHNGKFQSIIYIFALKRCVNGFDKELFQKWEVLNSKNTLKLSDKDKQLINFL